jgi:acyl phosphate:glycerol-3-phosphate acyltransferase
MITLLIILIGGYLLGSIPSAVWLGKLVCGIDVREHGSKNAGATNTVRVLGWKVGGPVLAIDILKGYLAVMLAHVSDYEIGSTAYVNVQLALGAAAVIGHIFPVFAGFRGGQGVAALFGIVLAIAPLPTLLALSVFFVTLFASKYVSLGSMLAGLSFPIFVIFVFKTDIQPLMIFSVVVAFLLLLTHKKNIVRLVRKEESKATFLFKKKKD